MKLIVFMLLVGIAGMLYWLNQDYQAAMAACQVEHSFDTCFYSLNH
jgi:hypothetical protein